MFCFDVAKHSQWAKDFSKVVKPISGDFENALQTLEKLSFELTRHEIYLDPEEN